MFGSDGHGLMTRGVHPAERFYLHDEVQMAGAIVAALPTLLIYIVPGRYFVQAVLAGSVKG
jgi:glucose/mannose transport system permease protein